LLVTEERAFARGAFHEHLVPVRDELAHGFGDGRHVPLAGHDLLRIPIIMIKTPFTISFHVILAPFRALANSSKKQNTNFVFG